MVKKVPRVHFIGIGGIGLSYLARWFLSQKWQVSGSDLQSSSITQELKKEGVDIKIGHKNGHLRPDTGLIIRSQAIPLSNPEVLEARKRHIPVRTLPEEVGVLTKKYTTIA